MIVSVTGYHGCHIDTARHVVSGGDFRASENGYDWLGKGIYFWEDAPVRASEWARKRFGNEGSVIQATLVLGECLNLFDTTHFENLAEAYRRTIYDLKLAGLSVPKNTGKLHRLDYVVVEAYCEAVLASNGYTFQSIRGCFPEGPPLFEGSRILRETHIQLSIRDTDCIRDVTMVN